MTLGERIKHLRERRGLRVRELARLADVPHVTLLRLEQGTRSDITTETAKRLARVLGVSVDHLVGMYEEDEPTDEEGPTAMLGSSASAHGGIGCTPG